MIKNYSSIIFITVMTFACESWAGEVEYTKQHDLLVDAIRNGRASGILLGEMADLFTRQFQSTGDLFVKAEVIKAFTRPDCKRIEVVFTKKDVETPNGLTDAILKTQLNYCSDGSPPDAME